MRGQQRPKLDLRSPQTAWLVGSVAWMCHACGAPCAEWEEDAELSRIVDELFVEVHYGHATMAGFRWNYRKTREEANQLLQRLRERGYYVHAWP